MKRILILLLVITGLYIIFNFASLQFDLFGSVGSKDEEAAISKKTQVIKVEVSSVSTTIIPEDRSNLKAVYNGKQQLKVRENGSQVEVEVKEKGFNWFNFGIFGNKNKLEIYIPEGYDQNMIIYVGSGNVTFSGKSAKHPMKLEEFAIDIGSGNMNLKNLVVNNFKYDGGSGNVKIDSLTTKTGTVDVASGNLNIKHYSGALEADISSGRLNIQMDQLIGPIKMDVSSGNVGLDLPDDANFTLNADVSSGNISCDFPITTKGKSSSKKSINGTYGSGEHNINIDVSSGNVDIH